MDHEKHFSFIIVLCIYAISIKLDCKLYELKREQLFAKLEGLLEKRVGSYTKNNLCNILLFTSYPTKSKSSKYPKWQSKIFLFWHVLFNYFLWWYQVWLPAIEAPHFQTHPIPLPYNHHDSFVILWSNSLPTFSFNLQNSWLTSTFIVQAIIQQVNNTALDTTFVLKRT